MIGLKKLLPPSQPIRCKDEVNPDMVTCIFPRLALWNLITVGLVIEFLINWRWCPSLRDFAPRKSHPRTWESKNPTRPSASSSFTFILFLSITKDHLRPLLLVMLMLTLWSSSRKILMYLQIFSRFSISYSRSWKTMTVFTVYQLGMIR